jgi:hypothetical protein
LFATAQAIVKKPKAKRPIRAILRFQGSEERQRIAPGRKMIIISNDRLKTICIME